MKKEIEKQQKQQFYNFQNETTISNMFKTLLKRHEDSQDRTKVTAIPSTTYEILRNTIVYINDRKKPIQSVNDKLRSDIINNNNWLTKVIELKPELKTATLDVIKNVSEFTLLIWLDNFEHIMTNGYSLEKHFTKKSKTYVTTSKASGTVSTIHSTLRAH